MTSHGYEGKRDPFLRVSRLCDHQMESLYLPFVPMCFPEVSSLSRAVFREPDEHRLICIESFFLSFTQQVKVIRIPTRFQCEMTPRGTPGPKTIFLAQDVLKGLRPWRTIYHESKMSQTGIDKEQKQKTSISRSISLSTQILCAIGLRLTFGQQDKTDLLSKLFSKAKLFPTERGKETDFKCSSCWKNAKLMLLGGPHRLTGESKAPTFFDKSRLYRPHSLLKRLTFCPCNRSSASCHLPHAMGIICDAPGRGHRHIAIWKGRQDLIDVSLTISPLTKPHTIWTSQSRLPWYLNNQKKKKIERKLCMKCQIRTLTCQVPGVPFLNLEDLASLPVTRLGF